MVGSLFGDTVVFEIETRTRKPSGKYVTNKVNTEISCDYYGIYDNQVFYKPYNFSFIQSPLQL